MREIKFRAYCHLTEKMFSPLDIEDRTLRMLDGDNDQTYMQYTGRKDMNGKEIYEGDIIKCDISMLISSTLPHMGLVVYVDRLCSFATKNDAGETLFVKHVSNTREVIGNIHENPELLS